MNIQLKISGERSCLTTLKLSHGGKEIQVPREALENVCDVLLEDVSAVPGETVINGDFVYAGWVLTLPMLPLGKPDEFVDNDHLTRYQFLFDSNCLEMRTLRRWDAEKKTFVDESAGEWPCSKSPK